MPKKPIVVIGSINMDLVCRTDQMPRPGETVMGSDLQTIPGGKGANQAVAAARLGHPCTLLGALGDDLFAKQLLATLQGHGVETKDITQVPGASGTASIVVDRRGENAIIVTPGANLAVTPEYLSTKLDVLRGAGMVLAQLEIPIETVSWLAARCRELGVPLMLDPAPAQELPSDVFDGLAWFTPNQTETAFYAEGGGQGVDGNRQGEGVLPSLFGKGVRNVVLKEGAEGALLATADGRRERVAAFPAKALDTTAAGDAFNGAFAVALMRGLSPGEGARFAAAAAAISVARKGAQPSLASEAEVRELLARA